MRKDGFRHLTTEMLMQLWLYFSSQLLKLKAPRLDYSFVWMGGYSGRMVKHSFLTKTGMPNTFDCLQFVDYGGNAPLPEQ